MIDNFIVLSSDQGTKLKILQGIDRPLKDLPVAQICENSHVSRKTFYRHFNTKYDPAFWYTGLGELTFLAEIGRTISWEEGVSRFMLFRRKEASAIIFSSENNLGDGDNKRRFARRKESIVTTITKYHNNTINERLDFVINSYIGIELCAFNYFLDHYTEVPIEKLTTRYLELVPPLLIEAMPPKFSSDSIHRDRQNRKATKTNKPKATDGALSNSRFQAQNTSRAKTQYEK